MHRLTRTLAPVLMLAATGSSSWAAQPQPQQAQPSPKADEPKPGQVDLRPKFKAGQQLRYVFDQTAHNQVKSADPSDTTLDQESKQTQRIGLLMRVVESTDQGATLQVVYESIKVTLDTADGKAEFDSTKTAAPKPAAPSPASKQPPQSKPGAPTKPGAPAKPAPAPASTDPLKQIGDMDMSGMLALIVGPAVGATVTVKTDASGAITSVTGGDTLGGPMSGGAGLPSPTQMANWLVAGMSGGGPGGKGFARVGDTWSNSDALSGTPVGAFRMSTRHTLRSVTGGMASAAFTGGIEPQTEATPGSGAQIKSATYNGTYAWDTRAGNLADMSTDMRVVLDAGVAGMTSRMSSETQVHVRRQ